MQQFHIKQPKLRSFSNFSFSASLSKWLMLFVCCCLFIYNWFISMNWGNNWLELTSYRILSCKVHIILVYEHLSIIFQESVKLSSPNTNKKWLSSMTFPHVTANAMSQAPDAIKCSCFSLYCDYHILLRFQQRHIIIRETFVNLPAVPPKLVVSLSFLVP